MERLMVACLDHQQANRALEWIEPGWVVVGHTGPNTGDQQADGNRSSSLFTADTTVQVAWNSLVSRASYDHSPLMASIHAMTMMPGAADQADAINPWTIANQDRTGRGIARESGRQASSDHHGRIIPQLLHGARFSLWIFLSRPARGRNLPSFTNFQSDSLD